MHERDLALRRSAKRSASSLARPAHDLLEALRQLAADRDLPRPGSTAASERSVAGSRCGDSNATAGHGQRAELAPQRVELRRRARQEADELVALADEPARDERGLDRGGARAAPSPRTPASSAARTSRAPGSEIPGRPASETSAIRSPGLEARQQLGRPRRLVVLVVARGAARVDAVARRAGSACAACPRRARRRPRAAPSSTRSVTSSRFPIGVAQTASGTATPSRAPRRRRSRRRSDPPPSPSSARDDLDALAHGRSASRRSTSSRGPEQVLAGGDAEAAADHDQRRARRC